LKINSTFLTTLLLAILCLLNITSCGKKSASSGTDTASSTTSGGDVQPSSNYLWAHHKAVTGAVRYTHKAVTSGEWTDQCKVDLDATSASDRDIMCVTETAELDLMHLGINLEYNVPAHVKCPYLITMPPYFFRYEPPRDDGTATPPIEPAYVDVTVNNVAGTYSATGYYSNHTTVNPYFTSGSGEYTCGFDYSKNIPAGPKCCQGKYTLVTTTIDPDPSDADPSRTKTKVVVSTGDWGGLHGSCLAGPALQLNPLYEDGFPMAVIWRMTEQAESLSSKSLKEKTFFSPIDAIKNFGDHLASSNIQSINFPNVNGKLNSFNKAQMKSIKTRDNVDPKLNFGSFEVDSLLKQKLGTTRFLANYTKGTTPRPFQDIIDYYSVEYPPGYNFLTNYLDPRYFNILCADTAKEITARIRVVIREWNTAAALKLATEPTADEDDATGNETDFPQFPNHDYYDWEDTYGLRRWNGASSATGYPGTSL